ncbi:hypothetical protein WJX84_002613 [Apatococcus fuscideae]|uniref:Uncharacterized protein n=1 Tax=Apatococcus fuscideae TaxID=2026836 RepID=A0AAW1RH22_9CHLO
MDVSHYPVAREDLTATITVNATLAPRLSKPPFQRQKQGYRILRRDLICFLGMAAVVPEHHDPLLGYGGLITFLIVVHVAALLFWLWQVAASSLRSSQKVAVD